MPLVGLIIGVTATLVGVEVMLPVSVRVPPVAEIATVGVVVTAVAVEDDAGQSVAVVDGEPTRFKVEPPLSVTTLVGSIWPAGEFSVRWSCRWSNRPPEYVYTTGIGPAALAPTWSGTSSATVPPL